MNQQESMGGDGRRQWLRRALVTPYLWLLVFFLAPFIIIAKISLAMGDAPPLVTEILRIASPLSILLALDRARAPVS